MSEFSILNNRNIIDILIGDKDFGSFNGVQLTLPYMSGPDLCSLCTQFGYPQEYTWGGSNLSRWMYMQDLILFLDKTDKVPLLLAHLFCFSRFENILKPLNDVEQIKECHEQIIVKALAGINASLMFAQKELKIINNMFVLTELGEIPFIETPKIERITLSYVRELPKRIKMDFETNNYDSVVTKSRTLIEEVLIYAIEDSAGQNFKYNGDLPSLYKQCKQLLGMQQNSNWDKRINELLSGLEKIINSISSMRNSNSDAHGTGQGRIIIKDREAVLIANAAIMFSEYVLSVYNSKSNAK